MLQSIAIGAKVFYIYENNKYKGTIAAVNKHHTKFLIFRDLYMKLDSVDLEHIIKPNQKIKLL